MTSRWILTLLLPLLLAGGCHRNVEPFDPDEQVAEPDLSAIFPEGVERSNASTKRIDALEFPLAFELGPEDRMAHDMPYEGPLQLTARVDSDRDAATRTAGDLRGVAEKNHSPGDTDVTILIDERL